MDKQIERDLADLEAIVDALPNYLTRTELYTSVPRPSDPRHLLPVSIGLAQDRLAQLRQQPNLPGDVKARLSGLEGRLQALERLYPDAFQRKLASEQRSRVNVARWKAEEDQD